MEVESGNTLSNPSLKKYIALIMEFYKEYMEKRLDKNPKLSKIIGIFAIFPQLTQIQLQEISGFSAGFVSGILKSIEKYQPKLIKKKKKDAKSPYTYTFNFKLPDTVKNYSSIFFKELESTKEKLVNILDNMNNNNNNYNLNISDNNAGKVFLNNRLQSIILILDMILITYRYSDKKDVDKSYSNEIEDLFVKISVLNSELDLDTNIFSPDIEELEREIVEILKNSIIFLYETDLIKKILPFFFIRKFLTQKQLKSLTDLSKGAISETVRELMDLNIIQQYSRNYTLISNLETILNCTLITSNNILKWEEEFNKISNELNSQKELYENMKGYKEISNAINDILSIFPIFTKIDKIFINLFDILDRDIEFSNAYKEAFGPKRNKIFTSIKSRYYSRLTYNYANKKRKPLF